MAFLSSNLQFKINLDYVGRKCFPSSKHRSSKHSSLVMNSSRRSWSHPLLKTAVDKTRKPELLVRRLFSGKKALEEEETYFTAKGKIYHLPFEWMNFTHPIYVAGSCNGWVCLWGYVNDIKFVQFVLWNPSTNQYNFLPPSNLLPSSTPSYCPFNSFYDYSFCYCAGFGFDAKSGDYNIIRFVKHFFTDDQGEGGYAGCEERTELFSLRDNCWTVFASPATPISESDSFNRYSVYLNGIYYWLATREIEGEVETTCTTIISLDFADKSCYSYIPFPDTGKISRYDDYNLVEFNGSLCFILYPKLGTDKTFKVWVMNCDCHDKSWTRAFDVRVPNAEMPLGFSTDGRFIYFESIYRQQLVYDLTTGKSWFNRHDYPKAMQLVPCQLS